MISELLLANNPFGLLALCLSWFWLYMMMRGKILKLKRQNEELRHDQYNTQQIIHELRDELYEERQKTLSFKKEIDFLERKKW